MLKYLVTSGKAAGVNPEQQKEIFIAIVAGTVLFLLFSGFTIAYLMIYWKRKIRHIQEVEKMKLVFNEELLKSRLEIKEQTLNDISQEIHDNVGQTLTLAKVQLNILDHGEFAGNGKLLELKETVGRAMTDLRSIAKSLNGENLLHASLPESIQNQVNQISRTGIFDITVSIIGVEQKIEDAKKLILFRILQESIQNIIKHSSATMVRIQFDYRDSHLAISVMDNGVGFDINTIHQDSPGLGLQNMRSRAALIGSKLDITSISQKGTKILITTPYV